MPYIAIPNPRPKKFWDSPLHVLVYVRPRQRTAAEVALSREKDRARYGVPTAVDRWIAVGLSGPTTHIREAHQARSTLEDILDDKVECQLHVVATEV